MAFPGPLFDTPENRVLDAASDSLKPFLCRLLDEALVDPEALEAEVRRHAAQIEQAAESEEFVDLATARRVAAQCLALIDGLSSARGTQERRLIQLAARFFVVHNDPEHDFHSPIGFDDDAEVVSLVARELRRHDVLEIKVEEEL